MWKVKEINVSKITEVVAGLCVSANRILPEDMKSCIARCAAAESSDVGRAVFKDINDNIAAAERLGLPVCQDTGMAVVFADVGQDVHIVGGGLYDAVNAGVERGYREGLLRMSVVNDPLRRQNTGSNTPCVLHTRLVPGDRVRITVAPKGFGSENMSRIYMLTPSDGRDGVINAVLDCVERAGGNPCPPVTVGVGIGGDFEYAALLAKRALCRAAGSHNTDPVYAELETELFDKINALGIGPQGFGGDITALSVNVEFSGTHIAGLPVAVNMGCHVNRHETAEI